MAKPMLEPGDYTCTDFPRMPMLQLSHAGAVRIFLVDSPSSPFVYECPSLINMNNPPANFQIWYSGTRKLRLSTFKGVVYAPNAVVEIGFNGRVAGAIVANRIIGQGNNNYEYDAALKDTAL
jgi:hypothetical protein